MIYFNASKMFTFSFLFALSLLEETTSFDVSSRYVRVGCYNDKRNTSRPLPDLLENFYFSMTWNTIEDVINNCSRLAQRRGNRYFGLQQYGECWSGKDAELTYARDGFSEDCVRGVGKTGANFVYKFVNILDQSCDLDWHTAKDKCFHISSNSSIVSLPRANDYCTSYRGLFFLAKDGADFAIQDRLIKTLTLNSKLNTTNCLVLSLTSVPYTGFLPTWNESRDPSLAGHTASSLGTSYECALKDIFGTWYHHKCGLKDCRIICTKNRDIPPTQGSFSLVRRNTAFHRHILMWLIVDDVTHCARECLMTDTCVSFKYEYKSLVEKVGSLCALSARKMSQSPSDLLDSDRYNYYERFR